jgi:predicted aspartyl protease
MNIHDESYAVCMAMKEIVKLVKIHGRNGVLLHRALIDTGTDGVILPRHIALRAGTVPLRVPTGDISLLGTTIEVEKHRVDIEIVNSGCRAEVVAYVPVEDETAMPEFIIGSLFLQKTGAAIVYKGPHPVFHVPGKFHSFSRGGGATFIPRTDGQHTKLRASTSAARAKKPKSRKKTAKKSK